MFVIGKHSFSSHVCFRRISSNDIRRLKDKGVIVFGDERIVGYVVCYVNKFTPGEWVHNPERYGCFDYDAKLKMDLFKPVDYESFTESWVAFMKTDISYELTRRGFDGSQFILLSSPYDVPVTPWVVLQLCKNRYMLFSAGDGRVVGANHHEDVPELMGGYFAASGGVFCAGHLDIVTTSEAVWSRPDFAARGNLRRF